VISGLILGFMRVSVILLGLIMSGLAQAALPLPIEDALKQASVPIDAVSVYARQLGSDEIAIDHFADRALNPASTMKLVTTYAALDLLGPAYRWRTEIYRDGELFDGVLHGNLVIKGYGNPELMQHDMWRMLSDLRQAGVRDIQGSLILDDSYFSPNNTDPGQFDNEPYRAYNAIPNAVTSNLNSTSFKFFHDGEQAQIQASPDLPEITLINQLELTKAACGDWRGKLSYAVQNEGNQAKVIFAGKYPASCGEKYLDLSLLSHASYTHHLFRQIWQQLGGTLSGGFQLATLKPTAVKLTEHYSQPLADVIRRINKYSNNLMTRQLLLTIAAERVAPPGNEINGAKAIQVWLASKGMVFPELVIENGSGLSRLERISARHLGELLEHAYASPVMAELMSSMPMLAVDGTVMRRLQDSPVQGRAHLKTGSLNGVRSIAGYILDEKGRRWAVVFIVNHPLAGATKSAQDALLDWVYHQP
jgi:D-alanyl-D-alanine carboxypeptidase/D-alanyl-D-alanine-endopeptidase (penicillin-binding protein 4)